MRLPVLRGVGVVQLLCAVLVVVVIGVTHARTLPERQLRPKVCRSNDFLQIQRTCSRENDDLLSAVRHHDNGMVCKKLVDLFYCVAGNVPLCFHNLTTIYKTYFHSPHSCLLSPQQIISLQNLTANAARKQGQPGEVDVEVDIIVPLSTPSMETSSSEEEEGEEEEGKGEEGGGRRHEEQSGSNGPTGGGSSTASLSTIPWIVFSCVGVWQMTSHLLLS